MKSLKTLKTTFLTFLLVLFTAPALAKQPVTVVDLNACNIGDGFILTTTDISKIRLINANKIQAYAGADFTLSRIDGGAFDFDGLKMMNFDGNENKLSEFVQVTTNQSGIYSLLGTIAEKSGTFFDFDDSEFKNVNSVTWKGDHGFEFSGLSYQNSFTSPVPEASTVAMMWAGLGLIGFMVARRPTPLD